MNRYLIILIIVLLAIIGGMWKQVKYSNNKWEGAEANVKAYSALNAKADEKNIALQLTVEQLGYFKDSVLQELDKTRRQLKIKNKNLKAVQSVSSVFTKTDTVTLRDTIFKEPTLSVDTVIGDKWYNVNIGLKYPSTITVKPYFKSEKHIIISAKRETVNPPKKFFLFRWFQRKHTVIHVDVVEKNPYVDAESSKYVEIVK
jgi:hypothetical protein